MKSETTRRSPWPYALIGTFVVFIGWLATFAVLAVRNSMDLERADYYEQTIRYQDQIDRAARAARVQDQLAVAYESATASVQLRIPVEHVRRKASGTVTLYRPSDASLDRDIPLALDDAGKQTVNVAGLPTGLWKLRVTWQVDGEEYFTDNTIVVKPKGS